MCQIRLAISESDKVPSAKGFYDAMEKSLNFVIKFDGKFFSYIQGQDYSLDLDKKGRLLGIEIYKSRDEWTTDKEMVLPKKIEKRQIHIKEHRLEVEPLGFFTNNGKNQVCLRFTKEKVSYLYQVAQNLLFEVNVMDELSAVWLLDLVDDFGFKKEMKYRKELNSS
jgi:hypothetical protein